MSEHIMVRDLERRQLLCAVCGVRWPCTVKVREILERIRVEANEVHDDDHR